MRNKIKRYLRYSIFFVFALLFSIMVVEGAIRVLFPKYDPSNHLTFPEIADGTPQPRTIGFQKRQIKNTGDYDVEVSINKYGLRESKELSGSDANSIFAVGESFTFGWGVEEKDRFSNVVETLLGRQVFNIVTPTSIRYYGKQLEYAERNGAKITTVIVGFFMDSDLYDYEHELYAHDGALHTTTTRLFLDGVRALLKDNSALYFVITSWIHASPALQEYAVALGLISPDGAKFDSAMFIKNSTIESAADELSRLVQNKKSVVLIIPSRALWLGNVASRKQALSIHMAFLDNLEKRHLNYVDMRLHFEELGKPLQYHFPYDAHWNVAGHLLAGKKLAENIKQHAY